LVFARRLYLDHSAQVVEGTSNASRILLADWIDERVSLPDVAVLNALSDLCVRTLVVKETRQLDELGSLKMEPVANIDGYSVINLHPACM
jgi:hypothetical protein